MLIFCDKRSVKFEKFLATKQASRGIRVQLQSVMHSGNNDPVAWANKRKVTYNALIILCFVLTVM